MKKPTQRKTETNSRPVRFYRVIDRNLKSFGQIDYTKQTMKLNPAKGDMVNTIIHEDLHAKYPKKSEEWVRKRAKKEEGKLSITQAQHLLTLIGLRPRSQ